jgi:hypothetical protein
MKIILNIRFSDDNEPTTGTMHVKFGEEMDRENTYV